MVSKMLAKMVAEVENENTIVLDGSSIRAGFYGLIRPVSRVPGPLGVLEAYYGL